MSDNLLEKIAYRQLFCDLIELINALEDSKDMIKNLENDNEYVEFTRGYVAALDCSIHMIHSILDSYIDYIKKGDN